MSGNKTDILDLIDRSSRPQVEKLIDIMSMKRPRIDIDRGFQRVLKSKLMSTSRKSSFSWRALLSPLSLLATSFLVIMAVWKLWGIPRDTEPVSAPIGETAIATYSSEGVTYDANLVGRPSSDLTASSTFSDTALSSTRVANMDKSDVVENPALSTKNEKISTSPITRSASPTASDIDITGDIASISRDMDMIIAESTPSGMADTPQDLAMTTTPVTSTMMDSTTIAQTRSTLTIPEYPAYLMAYSKEGVWSEGEKKSRSGSGITSKREKTIGRDIMLQKFESIGAMTVTLEYHIAKKSGDTLIYLVPMLISTQGRYSLIEGYTE